MARSVILAVDVDTTPGKVFDAISTREGLTSFWTPNAEASPEVGTDLQFGFAAAPVDLEMTVKTLERDGLIEWECAGPWPYWGGTRVHWIITDDNPTRVLFRHSGFADDQPEDDFGSLAYTWATVLTALKAYLETGVPSPALP